MENLCQRFSVTNSVHLTTKIMLLYCLSHIHLWTVIRPNLTSLWWHSLWWHEILPSKLISHKI